MEKINIIGVPEHFNFPWLQVVASQPFASSEIILEWEDESRGSGAMIKALRDGSADIAVVLTESFIKDRIEGNPSKIIGFHVRSPLLWGIHVSSKSKIDSVSDLKNVPFLISRLGSGSHLMAYLLAKQEGWPLKELQFEIVGNMDGAKKAFRSTLPKVFLWEKFTTQPMVDQGLFTRVGEIPTPWPCFVMVASEGAIQKHGKILLEIRNLVYEESRILSNDLKLIPRLSQQYGISEADLETWWVQTAWATDGTVSISDLEMTMKTLKELDLIKSIVPALDLVDESFVSLI
ncbi:type 2 periplasmic-binding domain-containing protein [Pararhodonellum marinum]|uniref:ABC transporter substrate-binding protein n=1 Tax=Pararhodonellum marinum TaxID=2755358 RepID=UPI00189022FC|nr:ABC transporter substrate-binding protein [Pararhodonellum marinum]